MAAPSSVPPSPAPTPRAQSLAALALLASFFLMERVPGAFAERRTLRWYAIRAIVLGLGFAALLAVQPAAPWRASLARRIGRPASTILLGVLLGAMAVFGARLVRGLTP